MGTGHEIDVVHTWYPYQHVVVGAFCRVVLAQLVPEPAHFDAYDGVAGGMELLRADRAAISAEAVRHAAACQPSA
jgi:hypothetical protein